MNKLENLIEYYNGELKSFKYEYNAALEDIEKYTKCPWLPAKTANLQSATNKKIIYQNKIVQYQEILNQLSKIYYNEKLSVYLEKEDSSIPIFTRQKISFSELVAISLIIKLFKNKDLKHLPTITYQELSEYSKIVAEKFQELKIYPDDKSHYNKQLDAQVYENPLNFITYIYCDSPKSRKVLEQELTSGLHDISKYVIATPLDITPTGLPELKVIFKMIPEILSLERKTNALLSNKQDKLVSNQCGAQNLTQKGPKYVKN